MDTLERIQVAASLGLTEIQRRTAEAYIAEGTDTFANKSRAYREGSTRDITPGSAGVQGHRTLTLPKVQQYIAELYEKSGMTIEAAIASGAEIIRAGTETIETEQYDGEGNLVSKQITKKPVNKSTRLKGIEQYLRNIGLYTQQDVSKQLVVDEAKRLHARIMREYADSKREREAKRVHK